MRSNSHPELALKKQSCQNCMYLSRIYNKLYFKVIRFSQKESGSFIFTLFKSPTVQLSAHYYFTVSSICNNSYTIRCRNLFKGLNFIVKRHLFYSFFFNYLIKMKSNSIFYILKRFKKSNMNHLFQDAEYKAADFISLFIFKKIIARDEISHVFHLRAYTLLIINETIKR